MTAKTDYYRSALSREEANRILLAKVSAMPFSNDSNRSNTIRSAKVLQRRTRMNLGQLANAKRNVWQTHMAVLDRDFEKLESTLEKLGSKPATDPGRKSIDMSQTYSN